MALVHGSLFSGIGGFDLAAEWMGWENAFHCEWNPFCQKILKHYWPNATSYEDITKTDFTIWRRRVDVLTGGFPCQPYSVAGKQLGTEDERHLWPEMLRAIREIKPTWVVGENVRGLVNWSGGLVFEQVQADLEAEGYEVLPFLLPAASVGAPHRRDRIWFIAYAESQRGSKRVRKKVNNSRRENSEHFPERSEIRNWDKTVSGTGITANASISIGRQVCRYETCDRGKIKKFTINCNFSGNESFTNSHGRRQSSEEYRQTESGFSAKEMFPDDWQNFPTQSPVCYGDDGFSTQLDGITFSKWRNESIKGGGNAVVVPLVYQIFKSIQKYEDMLYK